LDKETVDEMIYNTKNLRNRLILELQARCGLRIGELLNIKAQDVSERKLTIKETKSGKEAEIAFMPEQIANRMGDYIKTQPMSFPKIMSLPSHARLHGCLSRN
jgi:integrase/recombinase XerD